MRRFTASFGLGIALSLACRSDFVPQCAAGSESCACGVDDVCEGGLECRSGICVGAGETGGGEDGASESDSMGDGDSVGDGDGSSGDGDGASGDGDGDETSGDGTTGDGDGTTGDGDGDGTTGDGDGTTGDGTTGDGDGDGDGTTGDGTTGDGTTGDGDGTTGDGDGTTGDGDGTTGDGDGTTGDGTTGDGTTGDGDGTTGDGTTGDGDGTTGDGDGTTGDGDGTTGDGDGTTGDGDGTTGDGDGTTGDGDGTTGDGDGTTGDGDGDGVDSPPVVVSLTPSGTPNLPNVTAAGTVTFTAVATDDVGVDRVEFFLDSTAALPFSTDDTAPYEAQYTFSSEDDGTHTFYAIAYDTIAQTDEGNTAITVAMAYAGGASLGQWIPIAGGNTYDEIYDIAVSAEDGSIYAVGRTPDGVETDGWYAKFDGTTLVPQWNGDAGVVYNGVDNANDSATAVALTAGGLVVAGDEDAGGDKDVWVRRMTSTGAELWTSHFDGAVGGTDSVSAVTFLPGGNMMLVGREASAAWISVVDTNGDEVWHLAYDDGGAADIEAKGVVPQPDGTVIIVGNYFDNTLNEALAWAAKFNTAASGPPVWQRTQSGPGGLDAEVFGVSALADPAGGIVFVGLVESGAGQVWLRKYDTAGTPGAETEYNPTGLIAGKTSAEGADVAVDVNGRIVVAGRQCCANDPWVQRLANDYGELWGSGADAPQSGLVNAVAVDLDGRVVVGGYWGQGVGDLRHYIEIFQP